MPQCPQQSCHGNAIAAHAQDVRFEYASKQVNLNKDTRWSLSMFYPFNIALGPEQREVLEHLDIQANFMRNVQEMLGTCST